MAALLSSTTNHKALLTNEQVYVAQIKPVCARSSGDVKSARTTHQQKFTSSSDVLLEDKATTLFKNAFSTQS